MVGPGSNALYGSLANVKNVPHKTRQFYNLLQYVLTCAQFQDKKETRKRRSKNIEIDVILIKKRGSLKNITWNFLNVKKVKNIEEILKTFDFQRICFVKCNEPKISLSLVDHFKAVSWTVMQRPRCTWFCFENYNLIWTENWSKCNRKDAGNTKRCMFETTQEIKDKEARLVEALFRQTATYLFTFNLSFCSLLQQQLNLKLVMILIVRPLHGNTGTLFAELPSFDPNLIIPHLTYSASCKQVKSEISHKNLTVLERIHNIPYYRRVLEALKQGKLQNSLGCRLSSSSSCLSI